MSASNEQARSAGIAPISAGRVSADGKRTYRLVLPLTIWWTWVGALALGLGDLAIQGHDLVSLQVGLGLLIITGLFYVCAKWPRVIADDVGITVQNPFRCFLIPWGAVKGIFLADSVEVECFRRAPKSDKTVYSWALSSPRRARARAQMRGRQWDGGKRSRPSTYDRLPAAAKHVVKQTPAEIMARELARLADEARSRSAGSKTASTSAAGPDMAGLETAGLDAAGRGMDSAGIDGAETVRRGGPDDVMSARWAWQPLAAILLPAIAFVIAQLVK